MKLGDLLWGLLFVAVLGIIYILLVIPEAVVVGF